MRKPTEPDSLPTTWQRAKLYEVAQIVAGVGFPMRLQGRATGPIPFFKVGDISRAWQGAQRYLTHGDHYVTLEECETLRATPLPRGSVVFAKIGAAIALNRRAILDGASLVDNNVFGVVPTCVNSEFLFYWLCTIRFGGDARATTVPSLRKDDVGLKTIPLPPTPEQARIVKTIESYFARLDDAIATLRRVQQNLKRYRAAVLQAAVEGRLVPTEAELARAEGRDYEPASELLSRILSERRRRWEEAELARLKTVGKAPRDDKWKTKYEEPAPPLLVDLPALPEGWCWATANQLSDEARPITYGVIKLGAPQAGGVPTLRSSDVRHLRLEHDHVKSIAPEVAAAYPRTRLQGHEVLVTVRGTLGGVVVVPESCTGFNVSREVAMIAPVDARLAPTIAVFIGSPQLQSWLTRRTKGIAYTGINIETLKLLPIPLPPLSEQERVTAAVEQLLSVAANTEANAAVCENRLRRLRQSVLRWAFEGKLVDQDPNDEPAAVLLERIRAERAGQDSPPVRRRSRRGAVTSPRGSSQKAGSGST